MCHGRGLNNKINNLHERALRTVYQDKKSSFETFLKHNKSVSIHIKKLQYLASCYSFTWVFAFTWGWKIYWKSVHMRLEPGKCLFEISVHRYVTKVDHEILMNV